MQTQDMKEYRNRQTKKNMILSQSVTDDLRIT